MKGTPDPSEPNRERDVFELLLSEARSGDPDAIGKLLEQCRNYLLLIANQDLDQTLQRKIGASDLVQESMLTAQAHFHRFDGTSKKHFLGWLRGILMNDVRHWRRHYQGTQIRDLHRETDITESRRLLNQPLDGLHTPGTQAAAAEEEALLTGALDELPENYRTVIRLRNWEDQSFAQIGEHLHCTGDAARKLWSRAIHRLQEILNRQWPELNPGLMRDDGDAGK